MNNYNDVEIIIVEDNPNDAEMALKALQKNKLSNHVQLVRDGEEALDFIFARGRYSARSVTSRPKVILLDLKLPKINGLEVLKALKENLETRAIPVVMMTSSSEESDMVESYKLGVNSYIVKPVDFEKFVQAVRDLGFYWLLLNQRPD